MLQKVLCRTEHVCALKKCMMIFDITRADFIEPSLLHLCRFSLLNEAFVKKQSYVFTEYL
jgi:hypothetical protein